MDTNQTLNLLTAPQAAEFLNLSPKTLSNLRSQSRGPRYIVLRGAGRIRGAIRYRHSDLQAWITDGIVTPSGAE
ncbi:MAG TPA: helix-turn-helix domain-containing protein [Candidatus Deferrimicrobiaceae bacterium]|jgi:predicted DNA-binding transcriptional regulator AlpA